ncbi:MAG: hypothetical protein AVDCRST_MAG03-1311, partial [uncultured Rubrobacteraceae bacterium]
CGAGPTARHRPYHGWPREHISAASSLYYPSKPRTSKP